MPRRGRPRNPIQRPAAPTKLQKKNYQKKAQRMMEDEQERCKRIAEQQKHKVRMENLRLILKDFEEDEWKYKPIEYHLGLAAPSDRK